MIANSDFNLVAYAERVAEMTDDELLGEGKLTGQQKSLELGCR